jgi:hypothetical protein
MGPFFVLLLPKESGQAAKADHVNQGSLLVFLRPSGLAHCYLLAIKLNNLTGTNFTAFTCLN